MASPLMNNRPGPGMGTNNQVPNSMPGPINQPPVNNGGSGNMIQNMIFNKMYQSNPQFRQFADSMRGKTPEQAFQEQGLDYSQYQNIGPEQIKNMLGF